METTKISKKKNFILKEIHKSREVRYETRLIFQLIKILIDNRSYFYLKIY